MRTHDTPTHEDHDQHDGDYRRNSLTLAGSVAMGTGVMIGAGIFALTGQVAELAAGLFPIAFLAGAFVVAFSAYSYVKMSSAFPSAGGIAMFLKRAYGRSTITAGCGLLMYFSMVISESLVARTFGAYTLRIFDREVSSWLAPALGVGLLVVAFLVNILGNKAIGGLSKATSLIKIIGIAALAGVGLWISGFSLETLTSAGADTSPAGFLAAVGLSILAYKGFTTITNSGSEIVDPTRNIGRSIILSLSVCTVLYLLVALAVAGNLSIERIIGARDSALAEAAAPVLGRWGEWLTIALAIVATVSGVVASMFAVSRMLAMLSDMKLVPHRHFGMSGRMQKHTLVYTFVIAVFLTMFFDLSRIASLGVVFYIVMDMAVHWGVFRHLRGEVGAKAWILITAIALDAVVLSAFVYSKSMSDPLVVFVSVLGMLLIFCGEWIFLRFSDQRQADPQ